MLLWDFVLEFECALAESLRAQESQSPFGQFLSWVLSRGLFGMMGLFTADSLLLWEVVIEFDLLSDSPGRSPSCDGKQSALPRPHVGE